MEEQSSFALLVGTAVDATTIPAPYSPQAPRSPLSVNVTGIGSPPAPTDAIAARAFSGGGFVLSFAAPDVSVDFPNSSGPSPKHLAGTFDVHFVLSARGYADLPATYSCAMNALPITPPTYVMQPNAIAVIGRVTAAGAAIAGATVQMIAESPPSGPLPPPVMTDADGLYALANVPAAQTATIAASGGGHSGSQTIGLTYPDPLTILNFEF